MVVVAIVVGVVVVVAVVIVVVAIAVVAIARVQSRNVLSLSFDLVRSSSPLSALFSDSTLSNERGQKKLVGI